MSIGLFDADMERYVNVPFNIDLMKMSAYYKKKRREIVSLAPSFYPEKYTKFIYRKDYEDGNYTKLIHKYKNIEYGGRAFAKEKYDPMDEEIEKMVPDRSIYTGVKEQFSHSKKMRKAYKTMMGASAHIRLSLDGETIWKDFEKQLDLNSSYFVLMFHDYDLNKIKDADLAVKELLLRIPDYRTGRRFGTKFPIIVDNSQDFLRWLSFSPSADFYLLTYEGVPEDWVIDEFANREGSLSLLDQVTINVTKKSLTEKDFIDKELLRIFLQVSYLRKYRKKMLLKYEDGFFTDRRWERIIDFFNVYANSARAIKPSEFQYKIESDSLFNFASLLEELPSYGFPFGKKEVRELFFFVKERNYELFEAFYKHGGVRFEGGKFKLC